MRASGSFSGCLCALRDPGSRWGEPRPGTGPLARGHAKRTSSACRGSVHHAVVSTPTGEGVHPSDIVPGVAILHAGHGQDGGVAPVPADVAARPATVQPEPAGTSFQVTANRRSSAPPHLLRSRARRMWRTTAEPSAARETRTSSGALESVVA